MTIDITPDECRLLVSELRDALGTMREGIYKSETMEFRDELKERKRVLLGLLGKLEREATEPIELDRSA